MSRVGGGRWWCAKEGRCVTHDGGGGFLLVYMCQGPSVSFSIRCICPSTSTWGGRLVYYVTSHDNVEWMRKKKETTSRGDREVLSCCHRLVRHLTVIWLHYRYFPVFYSLILTGDVGANAGANVAILWNDRQTRKNDEEKSKRSQDTQTRKRGVNKWTLVPSGATTSTAHFPVHEHTWKGGGNPTHENWLFAMRFIFSPSSPPPHINNAWCLFSTQI